MEKKKEENRKKRIILNIFTVVCIVVLVYSSYKLFDIYFDSIQAEKDFQKVEKELKEDKKTFFKENEDIVAWITIKDTNVDYPVVHTPENPEFYIRKDLKKEYSMPGTPFDGKNCDIYSKSFIIYGHNMKTGTMFHDLLKYKKEDFYDNHKIIDFTTEEEEKQYKIVASFLTEVGPEDSNAYFKYYNYCGEISDNQLMKFAKKVYKYTTYDTGEKVEKKDRIMILSTCSYHKENGRFVVVAKEI